MKKFIPKEKLGKKARRQLDSEQRTTWAFSPMTKKVERKKLYNRIGKAHDRYALCVLPFCFLALVLIIFFPLSAAASPNQPEASIHSPSVKAADDSWDIDITGDKSVDTEDLSHLVINTGFKGACMDPDVLVLCPVTKNFKDRKGKTSIQAGRELAHYLDGTCSIITDETNDGGDALRAVLRGDLSSDYGTIILATHSSLVARKDGTNYTSFLMYSSFSKDDAKAVFNSLVEEFHIPSEYAQDRTDTSVPLTEDQKEHWWICLRETEDEEQQSIFILDTRKVTRYRISISSDYIEELYKKSWFPNTVFYLGSCEGLACESFDSFLLSHGATCVIGYTRNVPIVSTDSICKHFFLHLRENDPDRTMTQGDSGQIVAGSNYNIRDSLSFGYSLVLELSSQVSSLFRNNDTYASIAGNGDFAYSAYGTLSGMVRDSYGAPIAGAEVTLFQVWNGVLSAARQKETDAEGHYSFADLPYGLYLVKAASGDSKVWETVGYASEQLTIQDLVLEVERNLPPQVIILQKPRHSAELEREEDKVFAGICYRWSIYMPDEIRDSAEALIQADLNEFSESQNENLQELYDWSEENCESLDFMSPSVYEAKLDRASVSGSLLSLGFYLYSYQGNAMHGAEFLMHKNYDLETGSLLSVKSVLIDEEAAAQVSALFAEKCSELDQMLFYEPEECVSTLMESEGIYDSWYMDTSGLHLVFSPGEISSFGAGFIDICIPASSLTGFVQPRYLPSPMQATPGAAVSLADASEVDLSHSSYSSIYGDQSASRVVKASGVNTDVLIELTNSLSYKYISHTAIALYANYLTGQELIYLDDSNMVKDYYIWE